MPKSDGYVPLHVHTDASPDGLGVVSALVEQAQRLSMTHLAMTDHGTLANAVSFWSACTDAGIIPILGLEGYLSYNAKRHHITLLSLDETGFNNLIHVSSHAHSYNYVSGYPLISIDNLEGMSGLLALTGCASSALYEGSQEDGLQYVARLVDVLGNENVAAEMMFVASNDLWSRPNLAAERFKLLHVVTNDTHFPCQQQFAAHQVVTQARKGFSYNSKELWLKTAAEIERTASVWAPADLVRSGLANTLRVAERVKPWNMTSKPTLPVIEDVSQKLSEALREAIKRDIAAKGRADERIKRLKYEFTSLKTKGFLDYIYILRDIIDHARNQGILIGPGRGSGGGSYVLYLLGITQVDPIEHNLIFERFVNPAREDYPDVDVDIESERRQEVIEYANNRWGAVPIATYSTYSHKSAIHDIARVLKVGKSVEHQAAEESVDSDAFERFINADPAVRSSYDSMMGQIRHRGKHAGGVVITTKPIPLERAGGSEDLVAAWTEGNHKELSRVGIVKYDLLGLTALSQLKMMAELTGEAPPLTFDDDNVLNIFREGDVTGIFQWAGSDGIRKLTMRISPRSFEDLVAINSLYRPGALDAGTAYDYPKYMASPRKLHPLLDPHLESTYGVICFQEQVMAVFAEMTGQGFAEADLARRVIVKSKVGDPKWEADIAALKSHFYTASAARGFDKQTIDKVWSELFTHTRYSFNKSHSTAYSMVAYQMAWYKCYHRPQFTVAMLRFDRTNAQMYISDAVASGLKIAMPHVNYSDLEYTIKNDVIFLPLNEVSYFGEKGAGELLAERVKNGPFTSYEDFNKRVGKRACNSRVRGLLERIGGFEGLAGDPRSAIVAYEELPVGDKRQTHLEALGYIVPTQRLLKVIQALKMRVPSSKMEKLGGVIVSIEDRTNGKGPYKVFHLSPEGQFWIRKDADKYAIGDLVYGKKNEFGLGIDMQRQVFKEDWL